MKLKRRDNKLICTYVTRWLQRPPHNNYLLTCGYVDKWSDLAICVSGTGRFDQFTDYTVNKTHARLLDIRDTNPDGRMPWTAKACIQDALSRGAWAVGLIDDDAFISNVSGTLNMIRHIFDSSSAGACGPMQQYRHMRIYNSAPPPVIGLIYRHPFCTYGCQYYRTDMLKRIWRIAEPMLDKLLFRQDLPLYMLSDIFGRPTYEFYIPGYKHKCGTGWSDRNATEEWYLSRLRQTQHDYKVFIDVLADLGVSNGYLPQLYMVGQTELVYLNNRMKAANRSLWERYGISNFKRFMETTL